ncbi:MAG: DUF58 domain-containing protein [Thermoleophilaceae bacterium]
MSRSLGAAALGLGLVLCGAAFDSPSLHVPGVVLLLLGGAAAAWVWLADRGARVQRELGPHAVQEEEPYPVRLRFSAGVLRPPGGELVEPLLAEPIPVGLIRSRRVRVEVRFGRRGRRPIVPARLVVRDPLSLAVRERPVGQAGEVIVLPRIEPVLALDGGGSGDTLGELGVPLASAASELELDSLRPYRPGAPASRIHWPTVARTGELMERRLVGDQDARPVVVLDPRRPHSEEALDMAVRAAASIALRVARESGCSLLLPGDRRPVEIEPDLRGWPALHVRLALVAETAEPPAAARLQRAGTIFWVSPASGDRLPAGLERAGASVRYLVAPGDAAGAGTPAFSVAGCTGCRLGRGRGRGRVAA